MPPKAPVNAPPASPPLISLLSSAEVINESERWNAGFSYEPETCGTGIIGSFDPCNTGTKTVETGSGAIDVEPFGVFAGDKCSTFGMGARNWQQRAKNKLVACQSQQIESELWRGTLARAATPDWPNKYLAHLDSDVLSPIPASPLEAFACLEQYLSQCNCGSVGMIHATPQVVTYWSSLNLIEPVKVGARTRLVSKLGTVVVPGSGYDGSGPPDVVDGPPADAASGSVWAYATGMVHIRMDAMVVIPSSDAEAINRSINEVTYYAERLVAVTWDCCHGAISLDLDLCGIGGAGS